MTTSGLIDVVFLGIYKELKSNSVSTVAILRATVDILCMELATQAYLWFQKFLYVGIRFFRV